MKIIFLAFLMSFSAFAAPPVSPGIIPSLTVGGRVMTDLHRLIVLNGYSYNASANYVSLRLPNGTAGYAVTTGKTLRIVAASGHSNAASTLGSVCYGDNDVGGSGTSAPTNVVYMSGSDLFGQIFNLPSTSDLDKSWSLNFTVPATKIPCIKFPAGTGAYVSLYGYEE